MSESQQGKEVQQQQRLGPSILEILIFTIYPVTIFLGILSSILGTASPTSYFANKHNVLNEIFIKNGWGWTTGVFLLHRVFNHGGGGSSSSEYRQSALRWAMLTLWWILVTQWCFGPPIMDKGFLWTGGRCVLPASELADHRIYTSAGCRLVGGEWHGTRAHDLSGHIFLLCQSSLFLWWEFLPTLQSAEDPFKWFHQKAMLGLLFLWWWSTLMTAVYFHSILEKVTGFIASLVAWSVVYILPKSSATLSDLFGIVV